MLDNVYDKRDDIVTRKMEDETVLVPLADNVADMDAIIKLNETGTFVWDNIDGERTLGDIVELATQVYDVDQDQAEADIVDFIHESAQFLVEKNA